MSYSLNSLKGGYIGDCIGDYYRGIKGDTRSLDYSSSDVRFPQDFLHPWKGCRKNIDRAPQQTLSPEPILSKIISKWEAGSLSQQAEHLHISSYELLSIFALPRGP